MSNEINKATAEFASTESDTISMELDSGPLGCENVDDNVGGGGCTAHTLMELKVFPTVADAMTALNRNGEIELQKRIQEHDLDYEAAKVYTANDNWCRVVITQTCIQYGHDVEKLKLKNVRLKDELKSGLFIIDGTQNQDWQHGRCKYVNDPTYPGRGPDQDPKSWRHSIAVIDGTIYEQNNQKISTKWLWLNDDNTVDVNKGYMRNILIVYRLTPKIRPPVAKKPRKTIVGPNNIYIYKLRYHDNAAPCLHEGLVTMNICKPYIRLHAQPGDVLVGLMAKDLSQHCSRQYESIIWTGVVDRKLTMAQYATEFPNRPDSIYTETMQLIDNPFHIASDAENVRKDKAGKYTLLMKDVHFFGERTLRADKLLCGKDLQQGYVKNDQTSELMTELSRINSFGGKHVLFGSADKARSARIEKG